MNNTQLQIDLESEEIDKPLLLANEILKLPRNQQGTWNTTHTFVDGEYIRTMSIKAGLYAIGHKQRFEALNIMHSGKVQMFREDGTTKILDATKGPLIFTAPTGRKVGYIIEDMVWSTIHPNPDNEQDVEVLEDRYIDKNGVQYPLLLEDKSEDHNDYLYLLEELGMNEDQVQEDISLGGPCVPLPPGTYKFYKDNSKIHGKGIFSASEIKCKEIVGPATFGGHKTSLGRFVNHSINPNCVMIPEGTDTFLVSLADIPVDTELTIDYRLARIVALKRIKL